MNILIFGCGAVGRGLLGEIFAADHTVTFIEPDQQIRLFISRRKSYPVSYEKKDDLRGGRVCQWVGPVQIAAAPTRQMAHTADIVFTAVRVENIPAVAADIAKLLGWRKDNTRRPLPIVAVENTPDADWLLGREVAKHNPAHAQFSRGIAECIIPLPDEWIACFNPTLVIGDPEGYLVLERGQVPDWLEFIRPRVAMLDHPDFGRAWVFKWLLHCSLHALAGFVGLRAGLVHVHEVLQDTILGAEIRRVMGLAVSRLSQYPGAQERLDLEISGMLRRVDTCARVARDAQRKTQLGERLHALAEATNNDPFVMAAWDYARRLV